MRSTGKAALGFIFVTILIDVIGFGIIIPVMPKLIMELAHVDISTASTIGGWMVTAYAAMQFLFSPLLGNLSDRYGRRPILLISLFGFGIDYIFLAFAPTLGWLFLGRIIAGITGASFTTATAYIADISEPEKRAQNFGIVGAAFGMGFIIGPVIGGLLGGFGTRVPFLVGAGLTLLNWLYGFFILPESLKKENRRKFEWKRANPVGSLMHLKKYPALIGLVTSLVIVYIASHAVQSVWSFYGIEKFNWHESEIGISLGIVGLTVGLVQGVLIRKTIPLFGQEKSIYIGLILYAVGMVLFGLATEGWMMYVFTVIYCLGGIGGPALQGTISNHVPANEQGELQGALTSLISVTAMIGPPLMTGLFSYFTHKSAPVQLPGAPFYLGAFLLLLSAWLAYRALYKEKHPVAPQQTT
ncbi:TCR/Tet family MFS transporter [Pseudobacter ginsenosidimutans]|uniref:DHA1 family tetracycline resistance protein-like MFS transporter n=1 Tax=Pseudobacter ginsenosidimutans TaxID=661488 RepID=A0A4Q7MT09_9BACT|nr:TCR/Tet family MFS transporter [Pseudobacter ginsenosidimutans]QEC41247.1 TCR/Tet family MFS transporter [Pseudobacter ginsenosidimutans]RZS71976.1 DHA1 family tetracycline resistance protein-like MFS transporter [Pseudobacter ginsenosidimutans]